MEDWYFQSPVDDDDSEALCMGLDFDHQEELTKASESLYKDLKLAGNYISMLSIIRSDPNEKDAILGIISDYSPLFNVLSRDLDLFCGHRLSV